KATLESAFGNPFDTPENSSIGQFKASCRFPAADIDGADLNMFLTNDVKGGIKDSLGSYFATKKSFQNIYGQSNPVTRIGKTAYSAFDDTSSTKQGSLLVLDGKNHAALVLATGQGLTADDALHARGGRGQARIAETQIARNRAPSSEPAIGPVARLVGDSS